MMSGDLDRPLPIASEHDCLVIDLNNTPSYAIDANADFLAEVANLVDDHGSHGANFGTDAGRLAGLGCESVVFGPGDIGVAHKPDEWMPLDEFARTPELLRLVIRQDVADEGEHHQDDGDDAHLLGLALATFGSEDGEGSSFNHGEKSVLISSEVIYRVGGL